MASFLPSNERLIFDRRVPDTQKDLSRLRCLLQVKQGERTKQCDDYEERDAPPPCWKDEHQRVFGTSRGESAHPERFFIAFAVPQRMVTMLEKLVGFTGSLHRASYAAGSVEKIEQKSTLELHESSHFSFSPRETEVT